MGKHVALIRGINVGKAKRVAMADLRALVEKLGYTDVQTLLNSGNVIFTSKRGTAESAARRIEKAIAEETGVSARVIVLTAAEIAAAIDENPLASVATDPSRFLVAALADPVDQAQMAPLLSQDWSPDAFAVGARVAYLWCGSGILESRLAETFGRLLRDGATTRNWATMLKIHALTREEVPETKAPRATPRGR